MEVRDKLLILLEENGIFITKEETEDDIDLRDYITDSIQFVSLIVEIEKELNIEFPNELLLFDSIASLNGFSNTIKSILAGEYICSQEILQDYTLFDDDYDGEESDID